jgi:ubiquinone biosynthesis protein COQ9
MSDHSMENAGAQILAACLPHVAFDGWSHATLDAALRESGHAAVIGAALFPRGGVDLAAAYHRAGDASLRAALAGQDLSAMRYRDRIAYAIRLRLELADKDAVRKGSALFALPRHAPEGTSLIWGTADAIWDALGDTSRDVNWYSKRATLSAVYASTVLYWLGDTSAGDADTAQFIDRRIENVMEIEKFKAGLRQNRIASAVLAGPLKLLERISAPERRGDLPGQPHGGA